MNARLPGRAPHVRLLLAPFLLTFSAAQDNADRSFTETENAYIVRDEGTGRLLADLKCGQMSELTLKVATER